jgi:Putative adhesin
MKALLATLTIAAAFGMASAAARADEYSYQRTIDATAPTTGVRTVSIRGYNGNIHLYGDGGNTVRVHAVLKSRSADALRLLQVQTSRDGDTVRVEDVCPTTRRLIFWSFADCDIELDVHYPRTLAVNLQSDNGNIDATGAGGPLRITNSNGNVTIDNAGTNLTATNKNGNVTVALAQNWHGDAISVHTNAGNVELRVPRGFDAKVSARTRMGDVSNRANLRGGSVTVTATTTFGNVVISRE